MERVYEGYGDERETASSTPRRLVGGAVVCRPPQRGDYPRKDGDHAQVLRRQRLALRPILLRGQGVISNE